MGWRLGSVCTDCRGTDSTEGNMFVAQGRRKDWLRGSDVYRFAAVVAGLAMSVQMSCEGGGQ